ncbi:hypothetical protein [Bradyrhizobium iriomotense]|uniref:hypothetical protein n=1 Tax=Bradyrhizobium iriomotense TaxID=441950 RepID=UPI0024E044EB|nr:hypothetical protein [Bradyrhizobium iriomotense]
MRGRTDIIQIARTRSRHPNVLGARRGGRASHKKSLVADQRGAVAFETMFVYALIVAFLLMPLADVAAAGFRFISAWSALRSFGQYIQYKTPLGADGSVNWGTGLQTTVNGYTISNIQVWCGSSVCSSGNLTQIPKYFTFSTTVTLAPIVWRPVLCPSSCTYTLSHSERFQ